MQEAALRALRRVDGFATPEDLLRWTMVVAHHQAIAEWRRVSRLGIGDPTEVPDPEDPADRVEAQFALAATLDAFKGLSDAEQDAIRAGLVRDERTDAPEPASLKMRRHRARRHLDLLVDGWR